jgi:hypothetical protein
MPRLSNEEIQLLGKQRDIELEKERKEYEKKYPWHTNPHITSAFLSGVVFVILGFEIAPALLVYFGLVPPMLWEDLWKEYRRDGWDGGTGIQVFLTILTTIVFWGIVWFLFAARIIIW